MFKKILIAILILNLLGYINYPDEVDRDYYQQTFFGLDRQDNEEWDGWRKWNRSVLLKEVNKK